MIFSKKYFLNKKSAFGWIVQIDVANIYLHKCIQLAYSWYILNYTIEKALLGDGSNNHLLPCSAFEDRRCEIRTTLISPPTSCLKVSAPSLIFDFFQQLYTPVSRGKKCAKNSDAQNELSLPFSSILPLWRPTGARSSAAAIWIQYL